MVFETLVFLLLNHLTRLIAQENFNILCQQESNKSHLMLEMSVVNIQYIPKNVHNLWAFKKV